MTVSRDSDPDYTVLDWANMESIVSRSREEYKFSNPFPHIVLDDFLRSDVASQAAAEFDFMDPQHWISYVHVNEKKFSNADIATWGPTLQSLAKALNSPRFVSLLSELTGIEGLIPDDAMEGGGLHQSLSGGFLNIHADFTVHPLKPAWRRRVNILLYFNEKWPEAYGGELELWSKDMRQCQRKIAPIGNRAVIFNTDRDSFHGHPEPMRCPDGTARCSLALYYFTIEDRPEIRSTEYRGRPGEGPRSVLIYLDKQLLRLYDRVKRRLNISDQQIDRVVRHFRPRSRAPSSATR